jgi:HD-GYP domain-containing protein (c-di-GMP phosphodiesterase class II)
MRRNTARYVSFVGLLAATLGFTLYRSAPPLNAADLRVVLLLASLAILAEVLAFLLPRATRGSLAFVAYLAMVVLVPSWASVAAVLGVKALTETRARIAWYKAVFNVAQHTVGMVAAILVFNALGGVPLLHVQPISLARATEVSGGPALAAFIVSYLSNAVLVSTAVALESGASGVDVLRDLKLSTVGLDLLISPAIFVFAWVYAAFGPIAAASLWIPILALRQAHKSNLDLAQTNQELLELMVKSLEARDAYTSGHSRRVYQYSTTIARAIGLSDREVRLTGKAALLHDVGKIHEKYAIVLAKTDKLTQSEWALIQEHPDDGADLISTMSHLKDVVPAVRHHHENWDGTGYPQRLAGDAIPLASRIIRLADTIDAMTSERPYRAPLTEPQVRAEIIRCRATQFDPWITDRLLSSSLWSSLFHQETIDAPNGVPAIRVGRRPKIA